MSVEWELADVERLEAAIDAQSKSMTLHAFVVSGSVNPESLHGLQCGAWSGENKRAASAALSAHTCCVTRRVSPRTP